MQIFVNNYQIISKETKQNKKQGLADTFNFQLQTTKTALAKTQALRYMRMFCCVFFSQHNTDFKYEFGCLIKN